MKYTCVEAAYQPNELSVEKVGVFIASVEKVRDGDWVLGAQ
jgi:hypothetical protein